MTGGAGAAFCWLVGHRQVVWVNGRRLCSGCGLDGESRAVQAAVLAACAVFAGWLAVSLWRRGRVE